MTLDRRAPRPSRSAGVRLVAAAAATLVLASCGQNQPSPPVGPTASAVATAAAPGSASPGPASPSASPSASAGTPPSLPPGVSVDPGLLEVLPAEVDGVALQADPDTAVQVGSDPLLADAALSIVVAIVVGPGSSGGEDLAVASVIRLRPDVFDEAFYQEWRDTYDEAACEVADGVEDDEEVEIDGRPVYVGTCVGGARTYHTYLVDQGFIVSITATGERHFGELIMAGLNG